MEQIIDNIINGPAHYGIEHHFNTGWLTVFVLGALLIEFGIAYSLIYLTFKFFQYSRTFFSAFLRRIGVGNKHIESAFLQLTFPSSTTKSAYATEQLHIIMQSMVGYHGFWDRLAARKQPYSMELVATRDDGIRYMIMIPKEDIDIVKRTLLSFLPGLKIIEVSDYLQTLTGTPIGVSELKLTSDFVLPLNNNQTLGEHDPIAYLTGYMRNLLPGELVSFQIVLVPVLRNTHPNELRHISDITNRIALNKEISSKLTANKINLPRLLLRLVVAPFWLIAMGAKLIGFVINMISTNGESMNYGANKLRVNNPYEQELSSTIKNKLDQHLFEVSIRILVASQDVDNIYSRLYAISSSFNTFTSTSQAIGVRRFIPYISSVTRRLDRFKKRSLVRHIFTQQTILSSSELADIYHFPDTSLTKTEGLVKSRSRELAAPLSIKRSDAEPDVIIGANLFGGNTQDIGITLEQRRRHMYIIGKTGTGKTTLLKNAIYQDMLSGKGLAVLDPHGDMFRELLQIIPENRRKDVVVFDPSDRDFPIGLNILSPGIDFKDEDDKHEWITSAVISIFAKLSDEAQWGSHMEHILRNTTLTALQTPNPTLYTLQRLLTDRKYQKEVAKTLDDPIFKQFWDKEFKLMGSMQMSNATAPLTHRLGHFLTSKMSRNILLQEKSTLRIADIMNEGKILLVNLSKGDLGEDQSKFFGTILTALIWMAAYQRTKIPETKRRDFFVYVDEFQNFATPQFSSITSEGRKFRISLIVSHQNIAQMEDKDIVKVIAGNAATILCLKANPEDEDFILPYMKPEVEKGDMVNLAPYHFYMKVTGDEAEDAFSGQTIQLNIEADDNIKKIVLDNSRKKYATAKSVVEEQMNKMFVNEATVAKSVRTRRRSKKPETHRELHGI
jgi:type IV secretory pathway TraG/TraD family ATPase VirD4